MPDVKILVGDCRTRLRELPDGSVHTCVTSPPYFGLRNYNHADQIGLEKTPDAFVAELVAVFREVRRVMRDDGTLWLNLGDSYAANRSYQVESTKGGAKHGAAQDALGESRVPDGLKPKDLIGIPWLVAKALQAPHYTGRIKAERDRAYLAGFIDGEGTITYVERDRGPDHTPTHDIRVFVTNTNDAPLRHFCSMTAGRVYQHDGERVGRLGTRPCFRWQMGTHDAALLLRELYPYLHVKRKQAALVWTLFTTLRHRNGHARTPDAVVAQRGEIASMVRTLNAGGEVDLPSWVEEPDSPTEPGWYLRSDVIWSKSNPMPESVTDRPTKAHEYLFLLAKSERYYYANEEIQEDALTGWNGSSFTDERDLAIRPNTGRQPRFGGTKYGDSDDPKHATKSGNEYAPNGKRNRRSVWTVPTQPFKGAHFATFPPALIEPCILAGSPKDGTVLDPFGGAGTTGLVADRLGRNAILCELNPEYAQMAAERIRTDNPMFANVEVTL